MRERPILICYDGSDDARRAIGAAEALVGPRRAVVLDMGPPLTAAESYAAISPGVVGADFEEMNEADALTRATKGGRELLEGSLSHQIAQNAGRPVLIVPPPK